MNPGIDAIGAYATVAGAVVAILALCVAAFQIRVGRFEARRATAMNLYLEYLSTAMECPDFSAPSYPVDAPGFVTIQADPTRYVAYEFYVSRLLFAAEEILQLDGDSDWQPVLVDQLKYHSLYLQSEDWPESHYSDAVRSLATSANEAYAADQEAGAPCWICTKRIEQPPRG